MKFRPSRLEGPLILAVLVACSLLVVLVLNSTEPAVPVPERTIRNGGPNDALLVVLLVTNQNLLDPFSDPSNSSVFPIQDEPIAILNQTNPGLTVRTVVTNFYGAANSTLPPGRYLVRFDEQTLHPSIPVQLTNGSATILGILVNGTLSPASFAEFSGSGSAGPAGPNPTFLLLHSSVRVANVSDPMIVKVRGPGTALQITNATVVGEQVTPQGLWLQMRTPPAVNLTASSVDLTVYTYSYKVSVEPISAYLGG
jgi:hypothetical protein